MIKLRNILINLVLTVVFMSLIMLFMILCNKYNETHFYASRAYNEMKASEYKMLTAQYQMQTAKLKLDVEEARLQVFLSAYGDKKK